MLQCCTLADAVDLTAVVPEAVDLTAMFANSLRVRGFGLFGVCLTLRFKFDGMVL